MFALGHWWYFGFAIGIGVTGLGLFLWAIFWDRSRGRKRCPRCWYSMDAAPPPPDPAAMRCPECGYITASEKKLRKTRRRWKGIAAGVSAMLFALSIAAYPYIRYYGIGAFVPAFVLIPLYEYDDSPWILNGIDHRAGYYWYYDDDDRGERLWKWQWQRLARTTLARIEERSDHPWPVRRKYQAWLALSRLHIDDPELQRRIADALERELESDDDRYRSWAAVHIYDPRDTDGSLDRLLAFLENEDGDARGQAVRGIIRIARDNPRAVEHVIHYLNHEDAGVRQVTVSWLVMAVPERGRHEHLPGVYESLRGMANDASDEVRTSRIYTLAHFESDEEAWRTIEAAWNSDDETERSGALNAAYARFDQRPERFVGMAVEALDFLDNPWWPFHVLTEEVDPQYLVPYADRIEAQINNVVESWVEQHGEQVRPRAEQWKKRLQQKIRRR